MLALWLIDMCCNILHDIWAVRENASLGICRYQGGVARYGLLGAGRQALTFDSTYSTMAL
jgi:hypothetical protein